MEQTKAQNRVRKHVNVTLSPSIRETLDVYAQRPDVKKSGVVEMALIEYFEKRGIEIIEVDEA